MVAAAGTTTKDCVGTFRHGIGLDGRSRRTGQFQLYLFHASVRNRFNVVPCWRRRGIFGNANDIIILWHLFFDDRFGIGIPQSKAINHRQLCFIKAGDTFLTLQYFGATRGERRGNIPQAHFHASNVIITETQST